MTLIKHQFPIRKLNPRALTTSGVPLWQPYQRKLTTLPGEVLTIQMYGEPLDQGQRGDCAGVSSRKARIAAKRLAGLAVVPISYFAQYAQARVIQGTMGQDSGETVEAMVRVYEEYGAIPESLYPETDQDFNNVPPANLWDASWKLTPTQVFHTTSLQDYKDACAAGYPVLVAFEVFDELESGVVAQTGWLPMPANPSNPIGGHQEVGGGYSDTLGAALIGNQWGDNWGIHNDPRLKGCHWMPYEYFEKYVMDIIIFAPDNGVQPVPQPTPAPFTKPSVDQYDITITADKEQVHIGDTVQFKVNATVNGQPWIGASGTLQLNIDNGPPVFDIGYTTGDNGEYVYNYKFDKICVATMEIYQYTPYGDLVEKTAESHCVASEFYRVQVGAFKSQANAVAEEAKVKASGFPAYIRTGADGLFRVQVGAFSVQANAQAEKTKLVAAGFKDAYVKFE